MLTFLPSGLQGFRTSAALMQMVVYGTLGRRLLCVGTLVWADGGDGRGRSVKVDAAVSSSVCIAEPGEKSSGRLKRPRRWRAFLSFHDRRELCSACDLTKGNCCPAVGPGVSQRGGNSSSRSRLNAFHSSEDRITAAFFLPFLLFSPVHLWNILQSKLGLWSLIRTVWLCLDQNYQISKCFWWETVIGMFLGYLLITYSLDWTNSIFVI